MRTCLTEESETVLSFCSSHGVNSSQGESIDREVNSRRNIAARTFTRDQREGPADLYAQGFMIGLMHKEDRCIMDRIIFRC